MDFHLDNALTYGCQSSETEIRVRQARGKNSGCKRLTEVSRRANQAGQEAKRSAILLVKIVQPKLLF